MIRGKLTQHQLNLADKLTTKYTAYHSFGELCINNPTLLSDQYGAYDPRVASKEVTQLRRYYFVATGRKAAH